MPARANGVDIYDETLAVFERPERSGPLTTKEVADALDCGRRTAYNRLEHLVDAGRLRTKKVGARGRVWWIEPVARAPSGTASRHEIDDGEGRDRELERWDRIVEAIDYGVFVIDDRGLLTAANTAFARLMGYAREDLVGLHVSDVVDEETIERALALEQHPRAGSQTTATMEAEITAADGEPVPVEARIVVFNDAEESWGRLGVVREVSARKRYEETLEALTRSARTLFSAGSKMDVGQAIVDTASEILDLDGVALYSYDDDRDELNPTVSSADVGFMRDEFPTIPADDSSLTGWVFLEGTAHRFDDIRDSPRLQVEPEDTDMRAGLYHPLGDHGILVVGAREVGAFDRETVRLVDLLTSNAETALDRLAREDQLRRQRQHLAALDDVNTVVREIAEALVRQTTRREVERIVCDRIAGSDSYTFAWIAGVDRVAGTIEARVEAGVEGFVDAIPLSIDPNEATGRGLVGRAVRTSTLQSTNDALTDTSLEPWWPFAREYGYRSAAVIPIVYEGTLYGLLAIHSARVNAFSGEKRSVIGQLGELIGYAIASIERKRALMGDELVELEFIVRGAVEAEGVSTTGGTITTDRVVPVGNGEYVEFGRVTEAGIPTLRALVDRLPHWTAMDEIADQFGTTRYELHKTNPPIISTIASLGGEFETARIEDGDYQFTVRLPLSVPVREVVSTVKNRFPTAEVHSTRRTIDPADRQRYSDQGPLATLTERQRAALEAAVYAGFFEWPRDRTGEDVAATLDISPSTFHQHLRKAERTVFDALLGRPS